MVLTIPSILTDGWTGLSSSRIINYLETELKTVEKKKEALLNLLHSGKITQETFDLMEKRTSRVASTIAALKKALDEEETLERLNRSEETRILESLLIDFKLRYLLGEIEDEEWRQKGEIINLGLDSLRGRETFIDKIDLKPAPPFQLMGKDRSNEKVISISEISPEGEKDLKPKKTVRKKYPKNKPRKQIAKEPLALGIPSASEVHCLNPWKPKCRNTDIELSIYYNGQITPICRVCWEEISKKNIEWSGL